MSSVEIIDTKFLDYDIRSCYINNTEMFLISDLIRQYNKINNTNKQFYHYLENKQTKELLKNWNKNKENTDHRNSDDQYKIDKNKGFLDTEDSPDLIFNNKIDIPNVIKYINIPNNNFGGVNKGYVVCEELLIACLMWVDPSFAIQVYTFLKNLRSINNDRFSEILNANKDQEKQINLLQDQIKEYEQQIKEYKEENKHLKTRSTPDNLNYHFTVLHNTENNHVTTFISKKQYDPSDKNIKRVYDLVCPSPSAIQELTINLLSQHKRFQQIDSNEFITDMSEKGLSMQIKKLLKQVRESLDWVTGLKV